MLYNSQKDRLNGTWIYFLRKKNFPEFAKFFFLGQDINNGLWWFNATCRLWCTGYLPYGQPANHLDTMKGVEKQSVNTNVK